MRLLLIVAACALAAAGSAAAQTKGFAPYTAPQASQTIQSASPPEPTSRPAAMAGGSARPMTMTHPTMHHASAPGGGGHRGGMHHGMRHHGGRHHRMRGDHRTHSAGFCARRATAHHRTGRAATHAIERCEAGRHPRHHGRHGRHHHGAAHHGHRHPMAHRGHRHPAAKPAKTK